MRKLALFLLLTLPCLGQSEGMLQRLSPTEAELSGGQVVPLDGHYFHRLAEKGLGSRWKVFVQAGRVDSALFLGMTEGVPEALSTLDRFIGFVNGMRWEQARQLVQEPPTPAAFDERWGSTWIYGDRTEWRLDEVEPGSVTVSVATSRSRASGAGGRNNYRAARGSARFTLRRQGSAWKVTYP